MAASGPPGGHHRAQHRPQLYIGIGLSGKFNHSVGIRAAGTVLAVNNDPSAPIWDHADIGIVAEWHAVVPLLTVRLAEVIK